MKAIRLLTCDNPVEAHLIKGRLQNEGIECFLTNENFTNLMPFYNDMLGSGVQIIVDEKDYHKAREILKDKFEPEDTKLICPNCGSKNIGLRYGKGKLLTILKLFFSVLFFRTGGDLKPRYYCRDCGTEIE